MIGIYKITNTINNKMYIGQSINIKERIAEHKRLALNKEFLNKFQYPLYLALNKYGIDNFKFEIIMECSEEQLNYWEQYWIEKLNTYINNPNSQGYNLTHGGDGHRLISNDQINKIQQLWDSGLSTGEISTIMEIEKHAIIRYLKTYNNYSIEESNKRGQRNSSIKHKKVINVYNQSCELIYTGESVKETGEYFNISSTGIGKVVQGRNFIFQNMYFIDASQPQEEQLLFRMRHQNSPTIIETDASGEKILQIFFNKQEIKDYLNQENISSIQVCCKGHTTTAYGHYWTYLYKYIEKYGFNYSWILNNDGYAEEKFK